MDHKGNPLIQGEPRTLVRSCVVLLAVLGLLVPARRADGATATVSVWNITGPIGHNPDASREDVTGITGHVATSTNPQSIAVAIDNSNNPEGPCGLIVWNPATNNFKDYGITGGFSSGVDIDFTGPTLMGPAGTVFGAPTFQPGDIWVTVQFSSVPLYVNFKGSNNFRFWPVGSGCVRGIKVDNTSGMIFFTDSCGGTINRLDPTTNTVTTWTLGGAAYYLALDSGGNVFAPVAAAGVAGGVDAIIRLAPSSNTVTAWPIPGGGLAPNLELALNGIVRDSAGNVWFDESASNEVGRLNPVGNEICEFTQTGVTASPQQVGSSGSGSTLQAFYTEAGAGEAGSDLQGGVSVLTQASAVPEVSPCPVVTPMVVTLTPATSTAPFTDVIHTPRFNTITPLVVSVTSTSTPGIDRFPMPFPTGGTTTAPNAPSGMTGVVLPNTVFGSYQDTSFTTNSAVFEVNSPVIIAPPPSPSNKCPLSKGFWKNHPSAWPVTSLTLGSQTYTEAELLTILRTAVGSGTKADASLILADQLIAAKLNIANGSDPTPVSSTIADADSLFSAFSGKLPYGVRTNSATGQRMVNDAGTLDSYNNGALTSTCVP